MDAALIAVLGTLLGSVVTHYFQERAAVRSAELARAEQLRQERISTYSEFAGVLFGYRRSQNTRWILAREDPPAPAAEEARFASYESRVAARQALVRVQLVCDDTRLRQLADTAFELANCLHESSDEPERHRRSQDCKAALNAFVEAAAPTVR
ncbi:hypothetical protein [Streptomyces sp. NBC_00328]|uniref:hypothetical protein n=1 Tax=Streptomyces sp. NBC_00328 TaxID=2903646 RepID=UPI002E2AA0A4|nr:hypothetical protein [Streptomyces sp. NBC_00328]